MEAWIAQQPLSSEEAKRIAMQNLKAKKRKGKSDPQQATPSSSPTIGSTDTSASGASPPDAEAAKKSSFASKLDEMISRAEAKGQQ